MNLFGKSTLTQKNKIPITVFCFLICGFLKNICYNIAMKNNAVHTSLLFLGIVIVGFVVSLFVGGHDFLFKSEDVASGAANIQCVTYNHPNC